MTTPETAEYIIRILRRNERHYRDELRQLEIQSAGVWAMAKAWHEQNPDDGVGCMSSNPYDPTTAEALIDRARVAHASAEESLNFATDKFMGMIP